MMRLAFSDLRDHAATWIGAFLVAVGCGYIGGWAVSIEASAETFDVLRSVGSVVIAFSSVAAVAVLALTANLTVDTQRRSYALWQLANMKPRLVSAVVLVQLVVVAVLGAICGTLLTTITFPPLFPWVFGARVEYAQAVPRVGAALMPFVWLAVAGTFLCGGLKGARSAGRTSPLAVLRESKPRRAGMTWMRVLLFAGLAIGAWQVAAIMIGSVPGVVMNWSLYLPILTTAGIAAVGPLAFAAILKAWTSVVPQSRWNAWYVARHTARFGLSASTSVETPIMVGFGLVAGIYSVMSIWADYSGQHGMTFTGLDWTAAILMMGGPVLLCAIGAAVSVVMTSKSRTRDVALLIAGGAQPRTLLAAAVCEAFIHAVTATLAGMAAVVVSNAVTAYAVRRVGFRRGSGRLARGLRPRPRRDARAHARRPSQRACNRPRDGGVSRGRFRIGLRRPLRQARDGIGATAEGAGWQRMHAMHDLQALSAVIDERNPRSSKKAIKKIVHSVKSLPCGRRPAADPALAAGRSSPSCLAACLGRRLLREVGKPRQCGRRCFFTILTCE